MAEKQLEHPALDHLAATPDIFRALLTGLSPEQACWKPTPERFSIAELLEHLSHVEAHCFRIRFDEALAADNPEFEPYDQNAFYAQGTYSNRDAEDSLAHWEGSSVKTTLSFCTASIPGFCRGGRGTRCSVRSLWRIC